MRSLQNPQIISKFAGLFPSKGEKYDIWKLMTKKLG